VFAKSFLFEDSPEITLKHDFDFLAGSAHFFDLLWHEGASAARLGEDGRLSVSPDERCCRWS